MDAHKNLSCQTISQKAEDHNWTHFVNHTPIVTTQSVLQSTMRALTPRATIYTTPECTMQGRTEGIAEGVGKEGSKEECRIGSRWFPSILDSLQGTLSKPPGPPCLARILCHFGIHCADLASPTWALRDGVRALGCSVDSSLLQLYRSSRTGSGRDTVWKGGSLTPWLVGAAEAQSNNKEYV
uniref:Uncharacterized protein n=1 Tax=Physcomitrium patens TaxID=3218 RepID=A0A2K1K6M9_PHYPA|nr:hypothetical protein PHYPA_011330 [Physcomitrium patens]